MVCRTNRTYIADAIFFCPAAAMNQSHRWNPIAVALYANAVLLLGILMVLLGRGQSSMPSAFAATQQPPIAGGNGIYIMPCQVHPNVWGCYVMDADRQTLCVYEYQAGNKDLTLTAARNFQYDLQLKDYNTSLHWYDVKKLVEDEATSPRGAQANPASPA